MTLLTLKAEGEGQKGVVGTERPLPPGEVTSGLVRDQHSGTDRTEQTGLTPTVSRPQFSSLVKQGLPGKANAVRPVNARRLGHLP